MAKTPANKATGAGCRITRTIAIGRALTVAIIAPALLTGCSGISKGQLAAAINEDIKAKTCFALQDKSAPTWPMRVRRPVGLMSQESLDPILAAMQAAGYLKIAQERQRGGFLTELVDVITPAEKAKGWWIVPDGFCVGTKAVAEVQEWTEPGKESGVPIEVKYTWHLSDVPSWAKGPEFKSIEGMTTPVAATTQLQKTNNGWKTRSPFGGLR